MAEAEIMIAAMRKKREIVLFTAGVLFLLLIAATLAGCATARDMYEDAGSPVAAPMAPMDDRAYMEESGEAFDAGELSSRPVGERHIIQNAFLYLEVMDIDEASAKLQHLTGQVNGYIASREIYNMGDERRAGSVSLRVPSEHFNSLVAEIKELGKVKNDRVYTDDVTMQYIDLEARIANMTAQEKRLRELLEKAESIEEIMQVERELGRVRGDLEAMTGNFRYLREQVQFSTIDVRLEEKDARTQVVAERFDGFGERILALLALNTNRFLTATSNFFIVSIGSLPILLPLIIIFILIWKGAAALSRKRSRKRAEQHNQDLSQNQ